MNDISQKIKALIEKSEACRDKAIQVQHRASTAIARSESNRNMANVIISAQKDKT